ncbi:precorrin-6A reductase [Sedimentibacter hydroxybenzoicus DSM 7310]|uniref:Precorrin-6A reductase n=1 Tax=Sedimentibacter hydroxybenzoicus DSM 7310 TaxID=1123245 RepID=A0A974BKL6_SEDHY|nr:precorrin-6A reductase [Sedimentibacter hydroxybenzoicus]NYB75045.1 precorrin-6A reductase [Sedimentibacter hydroxybenzoicus DSM 7310]
MNVCIFGGTTEGRLLAEFLSELNAETDLYIATEYGEQFVKGLKNVNVHQSRLDKKSMIELFKNSSVDYVVDATHPFAKIVSQNVREAAEYCNLKYYRIIREADKDEYPIYFDHVENIVRYLNDNEGNILLTTGSKDLDKFTGINNYKERIFVRILPMESSLKRALELAYSNKNIICMQGPFSEELNIAMINSIGSNGTKFLVTKESAASGGFEEKISACIKTNTKCLVLKMAEEEGITLKNFKEIIRGNI